LTGVSAWPRTRNQDEGIKEGWTFLTVLAFNLVGDALRALTDPRQGAL